MASRLMNWDRFLDWLASPRLIAAEVIVLLGMVAYLVYMVATR